MILFAKKQLCIARLIRLMMLSVSIVVNSEKYVNFVTFILFNFHIANISHKSNINLNSRSIPTVYDLNF